MYVLTRRQKFPRGSIVIAGALSRLKTSLQEQREPGPFCNYPPVLSPPRPPLSLPLSRHLSLSLTLSRRSPVHRVTPPPPPGPQHTPRSIQEFDFSAASLCDTSIRGNKKDVFLGICLIPFERAARPSPSLPPRSTRFRERAARDRPIPRDLRVSDSPRFLTFLRASGTFRRFPRASGKLACVKRYLGFPIECNYFCIRTDRFYQTRTLGESSSTG